MLFYANTGGKLLRADASHINEMADWTSTKAGLPTGYLSIRFQDDTLKTLQGIEVALAVSDREHHYIGMFTSVDYS